MQPQGDPSYNPKNEHKGKFIPYSNIPQNKEGHKNINLNQGFEPIKNQDYGGYHGPTNIGNLPHEERHHEGHIHDNKNYLHQNIPDNMQSFLI